jgi:hypothetical protein
MSSAADTIASRPIKLCLVGDSGVGKTGSKVSLILAGYKVRSIDVDNGEDIVLNALNSPDSPYYKLAQELNLSDAFRYETVNHKMITLDDTKRVRIQPAAATVWPAIEKLLHRWKESCGVDLGSITSWGDDTVLFVDSGTFAGYAALYYVQQLNNHLGSEPSGNAWRRDIGGAQSHLESMFQLLYSDAVKCHVVVITHINYMTENTQDIDGRPTKIISSSATDIFGVQRAYPTAIGRALGPKIGRYFNNVLEMRNEGVGVSTRHVIHTTPQGAVNVKTSAPFSLARTYDISTGLAEIFAVLRGQEKPAFVNKLNLKGKQT